MALNRPLVSIALCTYNGGRFLAQQLDSLLEQTYPHLQIVASDDGSSDDTIPILKRYAARDSRISVLAHSLNVGFAKNFERTMRLCRGAYIAPCDQDDVWSPEKIATLLGVIGGGSLAYCDSMLANDCGEPMGTRMSQIVPMRSTNDPTMFAFGNYVSGHAMLFDRSLLEHALPTPPAFFYDWWIAAVAASVRGIVFCDTSLVLYRQHGGNVTDSRLSEMMQQAGLRAAVRTNGSHMQGHKLRYLRETQQRLESLARLSGPNQPFVMELLRLWRAREAQWFSPALGVFAMRHRNRLLAATTLSVRKRRRYCVDLLWGLRLKRLMDRRAYVEADV